METKELIPILTPGQQKRIIPMLPPNGSNILEFCKLLAQALEEGRRILRGETLGKFVKLMTELHKLIDDEIETQPTESKQTDFL